MSTCKNCGSKYTSTIKPNFQNYCSIECKTTDEFNKTISTTNNPYQFSNIYELIKKLKSLEKSDPEYEKYIDANTSLIRGFLDNTIIYDSNYYNGYSPKIEDFENLIFSSKTMPIPIPIKTRKGGKNKTKKGKRKWSQKYKKSINCKRPKGFSQKQYCKYGRKK